MLQQRLASIERNGSAGGAPKLRKGSAAHSQPQIGNGETKSERLNRYLSCEGAARRTPTLKGTVSDTRKSDTISLGVARPNSEFYPWQSVTFEAKDTGRQGHQKRSVSGIPISCTNEDGEYDLSTALGYGSAAGSSQLVNFMTEHIELLHNPPYEDWQTCLTCGTTSALDILFRMLCDRGDWIIAEAYSYPGAIEATKPLRLNILAVEIDGEGPVPHDLDSKLTNWDATMGPKPRVMYMVPSGHNPTGVTHTTERRKAIYRMAEKHDFLIIEDDPYYLLQLEMTVLPSERGIDSVSGLDKYLHSLPISYLSLDTSGRVLRLDSASKILAPGLRCGWLTGPSGLVRKFLNHTDASVLHPSGPSQVMMYRLLVKQWGHEGFLEWLCKLAAKYRLRRDILVGSCKQHLPTEICHWSIPTTGMFLWIDIDWTKHPAYHSFDSVEQEKAFLLEVEERIFRKARENGVFVNKGSWFGADPAELIALSFRLTYVAVSENALQCAVDRFGRAIRDDFAH